MSGYHVAPNTNADADDNDGDDDVVMILRWQRSHLPLTLRPPFSAAILADEVFAALAAAAAFDADRCACEPQALRIPEAAATRDRTTATRA